MASHYTEGVRLGSRNNFSSGRAVMRWHGLPREVLGQHPWGGVQETSEMWHLGMWSAGWWDGLGLDWMAWEVFSNLSDSL